MTMLRRSSGGVPNELISRSPNRDICSVLGMGVAVIVRISTLTRSFFNLSLCSTPNRCSSSMIKSPRSLKLTSPLKRRCVPMSISIFPAFVRAIISLVSLGVLNRFNTSIQTGKSANRSVKVLLCCTLKTVVGVRTATC